MLLGSRVLKETGFRNLIDRLRVDARVQAAIASASLAIAGFLPPMLLARNLGPEVFGEIAPYMTFQLLAHLLVYGPFALGVFHLAKEGNQAGAYNLRRRVIGPSIIASAVLGTIAPLMGLGPVAAAPLFLAIGIQQGAASLNQMQLLAAGRRVRGAVVLVRGHVLRAMVILWCGDQWALTITGLWAVTGLAFFLEIWSVRLPKLVDTNRLGRRSRTVSAAMLWSPVMWGQQASDRWALALFKPPESVSLYGAHSQLAAPFGVITDGILQYFMGSPDGSDRIQRLLRRPKPLFAIVSLASAGAALVGGFPFSLLFGSKYEYDGVTFGLMALATAMTAGALLPATVLIEARVEGTVVRTRLILGGVNIAATFSAAPHGPRWVVLANLLFGVAQFSILRKRCLRLQNGPLEFREPVGD